MRRDCRELDAIRFPGGPPSLVAPKKAIASLRCIMPAKGIVTPEMEYVAIRENAECAAKGIKAI